MLVDTHAHLSNPKYGSSLDEIIAKAKENSVEKIICASSNIADSEKAIEISRKYPDTVFAVCGIHPQQTDPKNPDSLEKQILKLEILLKSKGVVAVGECGLDYSPAPPDEKDRPKEEQFFLFKRQIELAKQFNLPVIIHARKAFDDVLETLNGYQDLRGVFHCYYGGKSRIQQIYDLGFYFGFDGNITYDPGLQNVATLIDLHKIILETDSPDLAPEPYRGSLNTPANVKITAQKVADLKGITFEELSAITTQNANRLFKL